jgi:Domain of unknown function (DUF5103)
MLIICILQKHYNHISMVFSPEKRPGFLAGILLSKIGRLPVTFLFAGLLFFIACVPASQQTSGGKEPAYYLTKTYKPEDCIYEPQIRTVLLNRAVKDSISYLENPVVSLFEEGVSLKLEFDELGNSYQNYYFKLVPCNYDWTTSILLDMEILSEYNEYIMDSYEISLNTRQPYIHYSATIPKVKLSGNYIVKVYRNRDVNDLVITRRFMVYDSKLIIAPEIKFALDPEKRFTDQQIDFSIRYGNLDLINPREMVKVVVRQNNRWDNAIYNLKPMFIREEDRTLDYHFFNCENCFPGLNEFRYFDTRSIRFNGSGIDHIKFDNTKADAWVYQEASRNKPVYNQQLDINGRFIIQNYETQRGAVEGDYVNTHFTLDTEGKPITGKIFVLGQLSDWKPNKNLQMRWDSTLRKYTLEAKIKQGYYNYLYAIEYPEFPGRLDNMYLEGTYNQTENRYDILVYFRPIGSRYDQLIGYGNWGYYGTKN